MSPEITPILSEAQPEELLPWHKPEDKRLSVSLDTANCFGSGIDGALSTTTC